MDDLISRQEAIDCISESAEMIRRALDNLDLVGTEREKFAWALGLVEAIVSDVEELQSVQSEIIKCKDCRHNGSFDTDCPIDWKGKEYCSFAER